MKALLCVAISLLALCSQQRFVKTSSGQLTVHSEENDSSRVVGWLLEGSEVTARWPLGEPWAQVWYAGVSGYLKAEHLAPKAPPRRKAKGAFGKFRLDRARISPDLASLEMNEDGTFVYTVDLCAGTSVYTGQWIPIEDPSKEVHLIQMKVIKSSEEELLGRTYKARVWGENMITIFELATYSNCVYTTEDFSRPGHEVFPYKEGAH